MRQFKGVFLTTVFLLFSASPGLTAAEAAEQVTFNKHIAPIVFKHCAACHRPGEVAPFSLLSYADVSKRAKQIQKVTASRFMPPWKSVAGHGSFIGERRLTEQQLALLTQWAEQGTPEGNAADLPPLPTFRDGWKLGTPDIVLTLPQPYQIPADGPDIYRNFVLDLKVPEGKFIKAAEFRPGNSRIVHHAALLMDITGRARKDDAADPELGYKGSLNLPGQLFPGSLSVWTPGYEALPLPTGMSFPWNSGADFILQLHLHPSGKPESDQSQIGFYLTSEPPQRSMFDLMLIQKKIDIAPGEREFRTRDELILPIDMELFGLFPHMHLIGREIKVTAHPPQGEPMVLVWINDWDFNWQNYYQCDKPRVIPAGSRIVLEATHDNSADNPRNPSQPPQRVRWGEQTTDEMSAAMLQVVPCNESDVPQLQKASRGRILTSVSTKPPRDFAADAKAALAKFDTDQDGKLNVEELAAASGRDKQSIRVALPLFDTDTDGSLNATELAKALSVLSK